MFFVIFLKKECENMRKYNFDVILFDLDGTLTDSVDGILNALWYACKVNNLRIPDKQEMMEFVGPPMTNSFSSHFGLTGDALTKAIKDYRSYYETKGWKENKVYDGIYDALDELKKKGKILGLATNKPQHSMQWIMEYFGLDKYFDFMGGSNEAEGRNGKAKVIEYTLENLGVKDRSKAVMVGDRRFDTDGAREMGIRAIGVEYGYGSYLELIKSGVLDSVRTPKELCQIL